MQNKTAFAKRPFDTATSSSSSTNDEEIGEKDSKDLLTNLFHSLLNDGGEESSYNHVWPVMELSRWVVLGSIIGFVGMIMGAAGTTVYYNLRLRHPTMDLPIIDYDLALLFQPMIMLGISIGVALYNLSRLDAHCPLHHPLPRYINKSTVQRSRNMETGIHYEKCAELEYKVLPGAPASPQHRTLSDDEVLIKDNIYWKELTVLLSVWAAFVAVQIVKTNTTQCSTEYWVLNIMQVASATSTFIITFSSSISVIQYYLLHRFPVPFAAYFVFLSIVAAFTGQHIIRRLIILLGQASLIIFVLAFTIFVSAISLGGVGVANMVEKLERKEHMGFENLCYRS
ncbi:Sulfite exporter TauE/SafE [Musa troglodytarum]|uniref:Sulfite exporter TauE/SafE n=1 Tax=Musa troglodytarum TaxID=320322 RepID=A0A9E7GAJ9_9LILI|nr:Sulfite exporter TauE/SafE [Musa troglodytarum]